MEIIRPSGLIIMTSSVALPNCEAIVHKAHFCLNIKTHVLLISRQIRDEHYLFYYSVCFLLEGSLYLDDIYPLNFDSHKSLHICVRL